MNSFNKYLLSIYPLITLLLDAVGMNKKLTWFWLLRIIILSWGAMEVGGHFRWETHEGIKSKHSFLIDMQVSHHNMCRLTQNKYLAAIRIMLDEKWQKQWLRIRQFPLCHFYSSLTYPALGLCTELLINISISPTLVWAPWKKTMSHSPCFRQGSALYLDSLNTCWIKKGINPNWPERLCIRKAPR